MSHMPTTESPAGPQWHRYTGNPEGHITASPGDLCSDTVSGVLYIKSTGANTSTGWTPSGSGGITNSASSGVLMKSDGTNAVASLIHDDGTTVSAAGKMLVGGGAQFSANTLYTFQDDVATATSGLVVNLSGTFTAFEKLPFMVIGQTMNYDTTGQASSMWGVNVELYPTHSAGSNGLELVGIHINCAITSAGGSDAVWAIRVEPSGGKINCPDGASLGPTNMTSTTNSVGNLTVGAVGSPTFTVTAASGNITTSGTLYISGTNGSANSIHKNSGGGLFLFGDPADGNNCYMSSNSINGAYDSNGNDHLSLNRDGYHNGATQFRDLLLYDGKENLISKLTGSTGEFYATSVRTGGASGPKWSNFAGTPESNVTGSLGDLCSDTTNGELYIKHTGSATNTGWKLVTHA